MPPIDPLAPLAPPLHRAREAAVRRRWAKWRPHIIIEARKLIARGGLHDVRNFSSGEDGVSATHTRITSFTDLLAHFERIHRSRLSDLAYHRIPWPTIRRCSLDDPRFDLNFYQFVRDAAVARRKNLLGRGRPRHTRTQGATR